MGIADFLHSILGPSPREAPRGKRFWLFYAGPENYLSSSGVRDLQQESFWSCESETQKGDLILIYRKSMNQLSVEFLTREFDMPRQVATRVKQSKVGKDFPAIWEATTNAKATPRWGWAYGCEVRKVQRIDPPLSLDQLKAEPRLRKWEGLRWNLQAKGRSALEIPQDAWDAIVSLIQDPKK